MRRSIVLMTLATIAIAATFAWRSRTAATSSAPAPAVFAPATSVPVRTEAATKPERERSLPEVADSGPFTEIRPELERRALAGDAQAARRLGMTLANCNHYTDVSDNKLEEMVVDQAARGFTAKIGDHDAQPEEILKLYKLSLAQKRRDCKGVSGLDEADGWKLAFQWIERAAALGDPDAQAVYGTLAFSDFDTRNALVDAEKMRDRKQLATDYLQRALAQGDGLALIQMAGRYQDGLLFPPDPEKAYAYVWAYSLTPRAGDIVSGLLDELLVQRGAQLDEAARERARLEGQRLATCCGIVASQTP
jgi:hypothetical protein